MILNYEVEARNGCGEINKLVLVDSASLSVNNMSQKKAEK